MKLLNAALALAVLAAATTVTVSTAEAAGPRDWRMVRTCTMTVRHHHRVRICKMVRRRY